MTDDQWKFAFDLAQAVGVIATLVMTVFIFAYQKKQDKRIEAIAAAKVSFFVEHKPFDELVYYAAGAFVDGETEVTFWNSGKDPLLIRTIELFGYVERTRIEIKPKRILPRPIFFESNNPLQIDFQHEGVSDKYYEMVFSYLDGSTHTVKFDRTKAGPYSLPNHSSPA